MLVFLVYCLLVPYCTTSIRYHLLLDSKPGRSTCVLAASDVAVVQSLRILLSLSLVSGWTLPTLGLSCLLHVLWRVRQHIVP